MSDFRSTLEDFLITEGLPPNPENFGDASAGYIADRLIDADLAVDPERLKEMQGAEFIHQGCEGLRRKDNAYLIGQRDLLQERINKALAYLTPNMTEDETQKLRGLLLGYL